MLQHIPNNFQDGEFHLHISFHFLDFFFLGQLEETLSTTFTKSANLRMPGV